MRRQLALSLLLLPPFAAGWFWSTGGSDVANKEATAPEKQPQPPGSTCASVCEAELAKSRAATKLFYEARLLEELGRLDEALDMYERRVKLDGWEEEVFESLLALGRVAGKLGNPWDECQMRYLDAYAHSPNRPEPITAIVAHYEREKNWPLAGLFASYGQHLVRIDSDGGMGEEGDLDSAAFIGRRNDEDGEEANAHRLLHDVAWTALDQTFRDADQKCTGMDMRNRLLKWDECDGRGYRGGETDPADEPKAGGEGKQEAVLDAAEEGEAGADMTRRYAVHSTDGQDIL